MRIGIVTTWFERGAAYVSRAYMEALSGRHEVFIYARGGERYAKEDPKWNLPNVKWGTRRPGTSIDNKDFASWVKGNKLDAILFNEQQDWRIVLYALKAFPDVIISSYVDYYTEITLPWFGLFDFLICNTKRHVQAMDFHPCVFYIPWGIDTELFQPQRKEYEQTTFFHSAGMSTRKGTEILIRTFLDNGFGSRSKLVIHTQRNLSWATHLTYDALRNSGIEVVEKTVTAPGLYHMGNVYVYPTRLDGVGLTMYEALSCGLPVIATDYPPMNEIVTNEVGRLVKVKRNYSRADAYYWPMSICDEDDLATCMNWYIENPDRIVKQGAQARSRVEKSFNWENRKDAICNAFDSAEKLPVIPSLIHSVEEYYRHKRYDSYLGWVRQLASKNELTYEAVLALSRIMRK